MAAKNDLKITISAVDLTSRAIDAVAKKLGGITAPVTKVTHSLARLSDASGVTRLAKAVTQLGSSAASAGGRMVETLAPLSGLTAALSLGGLAKMTSDWAQFSQGLGFDAARIGSTVTDLHALEGAARLAGSSGEAAANGVRTLQDVMTDAVDGRNMQALVYFRKLNVAFEDGHGNALRATAVMPKLFEALRKIQDPSRRARVASVFFGGAAESLMPWINQGEAGFAKYEEMARHYGLQTQRSVEKANAFREAQTRLVTSFESLGYAISESVSAPLSRMMVFLAELVNKWRPAIAKTFGEWAEAAGKWVEKTDWPQVIKNIETLAIRFKNLMDNIANYTPPRWLQWVLDRFRSDDHEVTPTPDAGTPDATPGATQSGPDPIIPEYNPDAPVFPLSPGTQKAPTPTVPGAAPASSGPGSALNLAPQNAQGSSRPGDPRGIRNNNPLNLTYYRGQGTIGTDGKFGVYATMADGIAANARQLLLYQDRDHLRTIRALIRKWAPKKDHNDPDGYAARVAAMLHMSPDEPINLHDRNMMAAQIAAMARIEDNGYVLPPDVVRRGVDQAFHGAPAARAGDSLPEVMDRLRRETSGTVKVDVSFRGLPPGTTAVATSSGAALPGVRIQRAMP